MGSIRGKGTGSMEAGTGSMRASRMGTIEVARAGMAVASRVVQVSKADTVEVNRVATDGDRMAGEDVVVVLAGTMAMAEEVEVAGTVDTEGEAAAEETVGMHEEGETGEEVLVSRGHSQHLRL